MNQSLLIILSLFISVRCYRPDHSYPRSGRMANLMTVFINNKTCSSNDVLTSLDTVESISECSYLCQGNSQCLAFSFKVVDPEEKQCLLFSSCTDTFETLTDDDEESSVSVVTGLLPGKKLSFQETVRITEEEKSQRDKTVRSLSLYDAGGEELLQVVNEEYDYNQHKSTARCNRLLYRSCPYNLDHLLPVTYSLGHESCHRSCLQSADCAGVTYYRQAGGGWVVSGLCLRK